MILNKHLIVKEVTFLDYVVGGHQLSVGFGIDFTFSNGKSDKVDSLHYIGNPEKPSPYEQAIKCVGNILI